MKKIWYDFIEHRNGKKTINTKNWIKYDELPYYQGKALSWIDSVGCNLEFSYNGLQGKFLIIGYNSEDKKVEIKYLDYPSYKIATSSLKCCNLGRYFNRVSIKNPELLPYIKNINENGDDIVYFANKKVEFICSECRNILSKKMKQAVEEIKEIGKLKCLYCENNISPELLGDEIWYDTIIPRSRDKKININNWVRHSKLGYYKGKTIDWIGSVGKTLEFCYNGLKGELLIKQYNSKTHRLKIQYLDYPPYDIATTSLQTCGLGKYLNKIAVKAPEMISYLKDPEDAYKHTYCKNIEIDFICPHCSNLLPKKIGDAYRELKIYGKIKCTYCGDGISSYAKFVRAVFKQIDMPFLTEVSKEKIGFEWLRDGNKNWRFDFYLPSVPNTFYEVNGEQHNPENIGKLMFNQDRNNVEEIIANDKEKEKFVNSKGWEVCWLLFYNCRTLEDYKGVIINSGLLSKLEVFPQHIDWNKCWEECQESNVIKAWNLAAEMDESKESLSIQVGRILGVSRHVAGGYLKRGSEIGRCQYDGKEEQIKNGRRGGEKLGIPLIARCANGQEFPFKSASECSRKSKEVLGIYCTQTSISKAIKGQYFGSHMYNEIIFCKESDDINSITTRDTRCKRAIIATFQGKDYPFNSTNQCVRFFADVFNISFLASNVWECLHQKRNCVNSSNKITFRYPD